MKKLTLKYIFGYAIFLIIVFLISSCNVNAAIVQYKFIDYDSTSSTLKRTNFAAHEEYTYTRDYVLFNGNERFFAFSYCATARFDFGFPNDFEGVTSRIGYSTGGSCNVQGYQGSVYTVYFVAQQVNDAGNGNLSIMFNTKVINTANYNVFIDVLSLTSVDSIPAGVQIPTYDGEFSTLNTKIDTVEQAVEEVKKAQSETLTEQKKTNEELKKTNDTLTDDDVGDSTNKANEFFSGFTTDTFGLTSIITAPLELIASITSSTCSPLGLKVPFLDNKTLNLPCMSSIYSQYFGSFLTIYQTITFGIIAYWVCVRIFALVKDFKNPDTDKVEVLDL